MAEYINIRGQSIEVVASDPANPTIGQIWYNSTSNTLKGSGFQVSAWSTGGNFGGPPSFSETQHYDGSTWTAGGNYPTTQRNLGGAGTQTAGLAFGGYVTGNSAATEEFTITGTKNIKTVTVS